MRDQKLLSSPTVAKRQTWMDGPLLDQLRFKDSTHGDDATGLMDWIAIWEQAPWRRT